MILTDNETKVDLLNNEAIAATICKLLRDRPDQPVTIGVHGDWGAGKSSVLEMIEAELEKDNKALCLKFNGWRFQGFEDAKIALIEGIVTSLVEKQGLASKAVDSVRDIFRRIDWLKIARKAGGLAFTAFTGMPTPDQIHALVGTLEALAANPVKMATKANLEAALTEAKELIKQKADGDSGNVSKEISAFRKAFDDLLKKAGVEQLVVLIDDLDRCLPDTAIETLEAVRLFVFTSRTAFVVAADEAMIEYAVRKHFPDLPETTGSLAYARSYLEKLIQVPFRIPALGETETKIYVTLLLVGAELGEGDEQFSNLISTARERLKRPWMASALDSAALIAALGSKSGQASPAVTLSEQIGPILASGTKGNPRQIKRFLNSLVLRERTAEARGFGDEIKRPILAKLMLAERFFPRLFDQVASIAASATDGKCSGLALLEATVAEQQSAESTALSKSTEPTPKQTTKGSDNTVLAEWLTSPSIKAWASICPEIGDQDLRPYLFVAKDRKDYFGPASVLGHLVTIVDQLMQGKLAVQALDQDLRRLAPAEAAQVFEAVKGRIVGGDQFDTEPSGAAGLAVLVKAHPKLQQSLLDFLEMLPRDRLGPWVCGGWGAAIVDVAATQRFEGLLEEWKKSNSLALSAAASSTIRTRKKSS